MVNVLRKLGFCGNDKASENWEADMIGSELLRSRGETSLRLGNNPFEFSALFSRPVYTPGAN